MWMIDLFFHEESQLQRATAAKKAMKLFREQYKMEKGLREQAIKVSSARMHPLCHHDYLLTHSVWQCARN